MNRLLNPFTTFAAAGVALALAACSPKAEGPSPTAGGAPSTTGTAGGASRLVYNLSLEPGSLDPSKATGVKEAHVILNVIQGLTRTDAKGQAVPGLAERWDVSPDGRIYTFHLREAKWQDGAPITAADFVYGWRRTLEPANAGEYAHQLFFVAGAEAFNAGKTKDFASVGVKALDLRTLEVRLTDPAPFFPIVAAHYTYSPINEGYDKAHPNWAAEAAAYPASGPFRLAEWKHRERIVLKKNPTYWDAANVGLDEITMLMVTNSSTALQLWEKGQIDLIEGGVPLPDIPRLKKANLLEFHPYLGTYYACFNNTAKPFDDPRVRRAFALAVDRRQITEAVVLGGQVPALAFVPPGIADTSATDFRKAGGDLFRENVAEAKRLLADAGFPDGKGLPPIKYLYNDLDAHRTVGEALQSMWQKNLGVKVELQVKEWKVFLKDRQTKNYQICRHGWIGDYPDPFTFLTIFKTGNGNNDAAYSSPEYDRLVDESGRTTDTAARAALLRRAEHKLIADDMAVCPLYYYVNEVLRKPHVQGLVMNPLGYLYLDRATAKR